MGSVFLIIVFPRFVLMFTFYRFFDFPPTENESLTQKLIKIIYFPNTLRLFSTTVPSFRFLSVIAENCCNSKMLPYFPLYRYLNYPKFLLLTIPWNNYLCQLSNQSSNPHRIFWGAVQTVAEQNVKCGRQYGYGKQA